MKKMMGDEWEKVPSWDTLEGFDRFPWPQILLAQFPERPTIPYSTIPYGKPLQPYACDKNKHTHIRFLVSNTEAQTIVKAHRLKRNNLHFNLAGACVQLSDSREFFPGTSERIVMVSGVFKNISEAVGSIIRLLHWKTRWTSMIRVVVPDIFSSALIGEGGVTLKSIIEESRNGVYVPPPNPYVEGLDRLVTVVGSYRGSMYEQIHAMKIILSKLTEDLNYPPDINSPFYAGYKMKQTEIKYLVSNTVAKSILYSYGRRSSPFEFSLTGADLQLLLDQEVLPGTSDRIVRVFGTCYNITMAIFTLFKLINKRPSTTEIRLIVPEKSCDALSEANIKPIRERSMTDISVSLPVHIDVGLNRLVTVLASGSDCLLRQMHAVYLILSKLIEDESPFRCAGEVSGSSRR